MFKNFTRALIEIDGAVHRLWWIGTRGRWLTNRSGSEGEVNLQRYWCVRKGAKPVRVGWLVNILEIEFREKFLTRKLIDAGRLAGMFIWIKLRPDELDERGSDLFVAGSMEFFQKIPFFHAFTECFWKIKIKFYLVFFIINSVVQKSKWLYAFRSFEEKLFLLKQRLKFSFILIFDWNISFQKKSKDYICHTFNKFFKVIFENFIPWRFKR